MKEKDFLWLVCFPNHLLFWFPKEICCFTYRSSCSSCQSQCYFPQHSASGKCCQNQLGSGGQQGWTGWTGDVSGHVVAMGAAAQWPQPHPVVASALQEGSGGERPAGSMTPGQDVTHWLWAPEPSPPLLQHRCQQPPQTVNVTVPPDGNLLFCEVSHPSAVQK